MRNNSVNRKHRKTLEAVFKKPVPANIQWKDIEALIPALGGEIEEGRAGSRIGVFLNGKVTVFHRPHPQKEADRGAVRNLRDFLESAGVKP